MYDRTSAGTKSIYAAASRGRKPGPVPAAGRKERMAMKKMMVRLAALVTALALCAGAAAETAENEKWQEFPRDAVYTVAGAGADTLLGSSLPGICRR